jgi:hypothetical protein
VLLTGQNPELPALCSRWRLSLYSPGRLMTTISMNAATKISMRIKRGPDETTDHENSRAINGAPSDEGWYREHDGDAVRENPD